MRRVWRWITCFAIGLVLSISAIAAWLWLDMQSALEHGIELTDGPAVFTIDKGQSVSAIARMIADRGWIERPIYFVLEARRLELAHRIQAGVYEIHGGDTPRNLLRRFADGDIKIYRVRFTEGCVFSDMRRTLARQDGLVQTLPTLDDDAIMALLGAPGVHPEGQFFPATYDYRAGTRDIDILRRAYRRMQDVLRVHWGARKRDLPYKTDYEALITASIIEKETGRADERDHIAGVFVRRLERNMKLQSDPTVIYGLGDGFDGDLRRIDLETDTPYNTYTRFGLPPTPIAMPGEAALIAALNPADGASLYFVATGDGGHEFSAKLEDHNDAVRRYQLKR